MSTLQLEDVKAYLNVTSATANAEVQVMIDAAEAAIAAHVGPLATSSQTVRVRGGGNGLRLPIAPATTLTSVTPVNGTALDLTKLHLDTGAAVVTYNNGSTFCYPAYDVVYTAGRSSVPADLQLAAKELVRHLWTTQRGTGYGRPGAGPTDMLANTLPGSAYSLPTRVEQLLAPYRQYGFA